MVKISVYFLVLSLMDTYKCSYFGIGFHRDKQLINWEEEEGHPSSSKLCQNAAQ